MTNMYTDPTPLDPKEPDYDQSKVSKPVKKHTSWIRAKMYGRYEREAISRAIEIIDLVAGEALEVAKNAFSKSEDIENRLDNQIRDLTGDSEIIDFRYSSTFKKTFNILKDRRDFWDKSLSQISVNVKSFGAKGDGSTIDDDAINNAVKFLKTKGGGTLYFPPGVYIVDFVIKFLNMNIKITGAGKKLTKIKVNNQSQLFHNNGRDLTSNKNTELDNLFRDFHSVFFFHNTVFSILIK